MGQHLACSLITKQPVPPMTDRVSAWSVYQIFQTQDAPVFIGVISDKHWANFCHAFGRADLSAAPELATNALRIAARAALIPDLSTMLAGLTAADVMAKCEQAQIPFAPIAKPEDLFDDPQLNQGGGFEDITFPSGEVGKLPRLPLAWGKDRLPAASSPPKIGEHSREILKDWLGDSPAEIESMIAARSVWAPD